MGHPLFGGTEKWPPARNPQLVPELPWAFRAPFVPGYASGWGLAFEPIRGIAETDKEAKCGA
jgi:hypothetical protein